MANKTEAHGSEHTRSYYFATAKKLRAYPKAVGDIKCDVCIVGGGFTGLSSALHLRELGYDVVVLEANRMGWGASGRNGGQMGSGQRVGQPKLEKMLGRDTARNLWDMAEEAKAHVRGLMAQYDIDCDLKPGIVHAAHKQGDMGYYATELEFLHKRYGYDQKHLLTKDDMADQFGTQIYCGGLLDKGAGHFHPLNFALGLADACAQMDGQLYDHSPALGYEEKGGKVIIKTDNAVVTAGQLILACNGHLGNLEPRLAGKIMPINNFVVTTEPLGEERARKINRDEIAVADSKFVLDYFRTTPDHRLLFGGGENYTARFPKDIATFVRKYMLRVYPDLKDVKIDYAWGGTLAITMNRLPHFGRLGPNIYYAQGYSGHGVALANFTGKLLAEAISGTSEKFDVFAKLPTIPFPGGQYLRGPLMTLGMLYYVMRDKL